MDRLKPWIAGRVFMCCGHGFDEKGGSSDLFHGFAGGNMEFFH